MISGGEDGAVKLWPLADVGCAEQGRVRLRTWQVPESSDSGTENGFRFAWIAVFNIG